MPLYPFRIAPAALLLAALFSSTASTPSAALRVGYIYPSLEYQSETSLRWMAKQLDSLHGTRSFFFAGKDRDQGSNETTPTVISNLGELDSLDVLVVFTRRMWMNPAQTLALRNFVNSGKGLVGLRTASHGIQSWSLGRGLDSVWGGAYNDHGEKTGYNVTLAPAAASSPMLAGVAPWRATGGLYKQNYGGGSVAAGATVYLYGTDNAGAYFPVAWSRERLGANVFYTSAGTQEDFQDAGFRKMVLNAVLWAGKALPTSVRAQGPVRPEAATRKLTVFPFVGDGGWLPDGRLAPSR